MNNERLFRDLFIAIVAVLTVSGAIGGAQTRRCAAEARAPYTITISEGIAKVIKDSRLIKISLPDRDMAFEDTAIARSALFPHLSAGVSKTFYKDQSASIFGGSAVNTAEKDFWSYGVTLYQTLYDFGKSLANYRASQDALNASRANIEGVKKMAVLEFVAAYFDFLQAEKMIAVAEKQVESISAYCNDVEKLYTQGVVVKNDLLPAQVRLADAKQKLIAARNAREIAAAGLNNILALPLTETIACRDIEMHPPELPAIEEAWRLALGQRTEIAFLDSVAKASAQSVSARARENLPTIYAQGEYAYTQNKYQLHQTNAAVQVGAKVNLYEGGADRAQVLKERARTLQLHEQREKLVEDIKLEIENSYVGLKNAGEKVSVAADALAQADENVRVTHMKYAEGIATATEVLEAISLQTGAWTNYYAADYELKRAYSRLMYSMGIDLALVYERMERGYHERANERP
jgi:outer membrane protein